MDLQYLYPAWMVPEAVKKLPELYVQMSNDPFIGGLMGYHGSKSHLVWFESFLYLEA
jgi:hypothetical protein